MNARRARFRAVRARMTGEARRRRNANTGEQCTPWLYTHLRGWQIKVGGWADWSVDRRRGGAREHQSSRVFIVLRTRMDGTVTFFVYHSFDLGGDEVNSPRIRRARSRIALLRADYLFERILRSPTCTLARRNSNSWIPISLSPFLFFFFLFLSLVSNLALVRFIRYKQCCSFNPLPPPNKIYFDRSSDRIPSIRRVYTELEQTISGRP